ncbi:MAG: hypothetical protein V1827_04415 [Candidatus Micrarchaeota archaeon]
MLLIEFLEEASAYLKEKKERLKELNRLHLKVYDRDIKKEMSQARSDIAKKTSEVYNMILMNLEEYRALDKYYPELLHAFMEDEYIGKILTKKSWLLEFQSMPPRAAAAKLQELRGSRAQLRDAKRFLRGWVGSVDSRALGATYPALRGYSTGLLDKQDAIALVEKVDKILLREGWLVLLSDSLINIPIAKYMGKANALYFEELQAQAQLNRVRGKGTVAETSALRKLQAISKERAHYERLVMQILLSNPGYLRSLKKKKGWLSREKKGNLDRIAQSLTPHTIKERVWLDEMRKKIEGK